MEEKKQTGRPSEFSQEVFDKICEYLMDGKFHTVACDILKVKRRNVYSWIAHDKDLFAQYACARDIGFDAMAENMAKIARTPEIGYITEEGENGDAHFSKTKAVDMIEHRKLQIDTSKWLLARWCPKRYGDKSALEVTGKDGEAIKTETTSVVSMSNDELMKIALLKVDEEE